MQWPLQASRPGRQLELIGSSVLLSRTRDRNERQTSVASTPAGRGSVLSAQIPGSAAACAAAAIDARLINFAASTAVAHASAATARVTLPTGCPAEAQQTARTALRRPATRVRATGALHACHEVLVIVLHVAEARSRMPDCPTNRSWRFKRQVRTREAGCRT